MNDEEKMPARPNDPWADHVSQKLRDLSAELGETKSALADLQSSIYELIAIIETGRSFFHFCQSVSNGVRRIARWIAPIITAAAGIYAFLQHWGHGK